MTDHVAIMWPGWIEKILAGTKTIESRWSRVRSRPWNAVAAGDRVFFKLSGGPVLAKAQVSEVQQYPDLTPEKTGWILDEYGGRDGIDFRTLEGLGDYFKAKRFCTLVSLCDVEPVEPFQIDKTGYGSAAGWLVVGDIAKVRAALKAAEGG